MCISCKRLDTVKFQQHILRVKNIEENIFLKNTWHFKNCPFKTTKMYSKNQDENMEKLILTALG